MDTTIEQQTAMDEAFVPHAQRLRIGRINFRLLSNIKSKESTLQLVYDVMRTHPFFKAFLVTADVPEIYMQEFWAAATVHHHAIRFKMDNKKHIMNLELFRDILHICLRVHGQSFDEPPFEEEILAFIHFLGHSAAIRTLTDVNINKLYQPWRSFAAIINKCITGKSSGYDSLRLSQAQILRNKLNWHYVRDDHMFSTIKNSNAYKEYYAIATGAAPPKPKASVRRTQSSSDTSITPPTTAASPRLTSSQKGKQAAKASKAKSLSALSEVAMTEAQQLKLVTKRSMQQTRISHASGSGVDEGTDSIPGVPDDGVDDEEDEGDDREEGDGADDDEDDDGEEGNDDDDDQEVEQDDDKDNDEEGGDDDQEYDDEYAEETRDEESFDPIPQTPKNSDDKGNGDEDLGLNIGGEEGHIEKEEEDELYRGINIYQGRGLQTTQEVEDSHVTLTPVNPDGQQQSSSVSSQFVTSMLNPTLDVGMESIFETTSQLDVQTPTSVAPLPISAPTMTPSTIATITTTSQVPILPTIVLSTIIQNLPNFGSLFRFDDRLRSLEVNFSKAMQTNQFTGAVSAIPEIVHQYMDQRMKEAVKVAVQIQSDHLCDEAQRENEEFLKIVDENMQKIIKEQVKEQVKILIKKIEGNKSIQRSDKQRNLYKALVEAYESDKIILDTYGETVTLKRRRDDDADKDEEPSVGPDRGSKRRREGKEPESASAPMKTATRSAGRSTQGSRSRQASASESALAEEPMQTTSQMEEPSHPKFDTGAEYQPIVQSSQHPKCELAKQADTRSFFNELMDTPLDFSNFIINRLKVDTLTPELLAGPTYELMKGSCKILVELEYHLEEVFKATIDQLDWVNPEGASSRKYTTSITKTKAADYGHIKWIEDLVPRTLWIQEPIGYDKHALWVVSHWGRKRQQFYGFTVNQESARDVYSKRKIITVTELKIVEWHSYKYFDWITARKDDDKLYKFKEGDFKRLRIQDIEDMLLLLRRVEDLQLGVESYQKKLNLTKPDSYRSDLKRKEAYTAYSNPRGFIYQNKDKRNRLMRIDELHKFSDGTLTDVRTALDDRLKGIWMQYLPQSIWRKSDKD
nr:hypothetical protein [Tanacetum cinerariifolium]